MKKILALLGFVAVFFACSEELIDASLEAGEDFTDSTIRVISIDTLSMKLSSFKYDSIITSSPNRMLIGQYIDPDFGTVTSKTYFEISSTSFNIDDEATYDSINLYLGYEGYFHSDTLLQNTINVFEITQTVRPYDDENFYNNSELEYDALNVLGTATYLPRPRTPQIDSLEVRLTDEFGLRIFNALQDEDINDLDEFTEFIKGITIQPGENDNGSIIGFSTSSGRSFIRLYYSQENEDESVQNYTTFTVSTNISSFPKIYNNITSDRTGTMISDLEGVENEVASTELNDDAFIQAGIGIAAKASFPSIKTLNEIEGKGTILSASLRIIPDPDSYTELSEIADSLAIYRVNTNNEILTQLIDASNSPIFAILNQDDEEFSDVYYTAPVGTFLDDLFTSERDLDEGLIFLPTNYTSSVERTILAGEEKEDNEAKVEIIYAVYDESNN